MGKIHQILDKLDIRNKLILLFSVVSAYILFFCIYAIVSFGHIKQHVEDFSDAQSTGIYPLFSLAEEVYGLVIQNHALIENSSDVVTIQRHHNKFKQFYEVRIKEYENALTSNSLTTSEEVKLLDRLKNEFVIYQNVNKDIIRLIINNRIDAAQELLSVKEVSAFDDIRKTIDRMYAAHEKELAVGDTLIRKEISNLRISLIILSVPMLALIIFIAFYVFRYLKISFASMQDFVKILNTGAVPGTRLKEDQTEIGKLNSLINCTADNFQKLTEFSNEIYKGNYETGTQLSAPDGSMAKSLIDLSERLSASEKEQNLRRLEDEQRNWTTQGLAKFGDIMRHNNENITVLSDEVIKNLVHYINAGQGGLFILDDTDPKNVFLDMLSAFAYDRKKYLTRRINLGDGLIGVCALEKNTLYITDVPDDYMEIESGLGDAKPKCLLIVPLKSEEKILGVIELASFNLLKKYEIQFVEQLGDSIASTLSSLRINARTADLLQESQKKSDELVLREAELRKTMDDMKTARDEAQKREAEMSGILSAVDETMLKAEIDPEGHLMSANQKFLSALGYRKDELIGRNIKNIVSEENLENFDIVWQNICSGQSYQTTLKQKNKFNETIWLLTQYTPIFDAENHVVRILYIANDITEQKTIEEKNKRLLSESLEKTEVLMTTQEKMAKSRIEMTGIMTAIDETMMKAEYTVEGNLLTANTKHIITMGYDYEKTKGKNILTFIPEEEVSEFKALWQNVCEGNLHQMTVKRKSKLTGKDIWLINQYTPVKDAKGKVLKILYTAIDITKHKEIEEQAMNQVAQLKTQNERLSSQLAEAGITTTDLRARLEQATTKNEALEKELDESQESQAELSERLLKAETTETDLEIHFNETKTRLAEMETLVNRLRDRERLMQEQMAQEKQQVETIKIQYNELEKTRENNDSEKATSIDKKYRDWIKSFGNVTKN
ncbi:MAG: PAS domain S-box protein [Bacteroidales bacterium]|nr:PAS domain S-box protein [Bacteroidales bacterium]